MKIKIEKKVFEFQNSKENVAHILSQLENEIKITSKALHSFVCDGEEVFDEYDHYLLENINSINEIEVILISHEQMVKETIMTGYDYLVKAPKLIEQLADNFYKSPSDQDWNTFGDLLEGIDWVLGTCNAIKTDSTLLNVVNGKSGWLKYSEYVMELEAVIPEFEEAVVNKDNVMIADILSYEIKSKFINMAEQLNELVALEG